MPALVVCGKRLHVGTDDFVLPALVAIIFRLFFLGCTLGIITNLFFSPRRCDLQSQTVPPLLYGSLFAFSFILGMTVLNAGIVFSISIKGSILDPHRKRKNVIFWVITQFVLTVIELLVSILCTGAVYGGLEPHVANALVCPEYRDGPLMIAKVIMVIMLVTEVVYIVGFFVIFDPCGLLCSPSILPSMEEVDKYLNKSSAELKERNIDYAANSHLGRLHSNHISYRDILRKLKGVLCCLSANRNRSRQTALNELSLALHTLFSNEDYVPSDLVAGFVLVSRKQKAEAMESKKAHGDKGCPCRIRGLRKSTFELMPCSHLPRDFCITDLPPPVPFDPSLMKEQLLMEDLVHYMRYAMGMYGWMLHVFDNPLCGICQLLSVTCCRCRFRCWNSMVQPDPELQCPRVANDDCCMSGLATMKLRSKLEDQHIIYITYENEVFQAPFSICVDDKRETVVLTVRGTLSVKDAMTDISVSMVEIEEKYKNPHVEGKQYMHKGMYITAKHIFDTLTTKKLLDHAFSKNSSYRLILTGHSLGAGVASLLSIMLKPYYPDLYCYAFSPPGCMFSFPLAWYSQDFIQSVVLGNDMISRVSYRSLFYLKRQMELLIQDCQYSKFEIAFRPRFFDSLPFWARNCLFSDKKDPTCDFHAIHEELKERLSSEREKTIGMNTFDGVVDKLLNAKRAAKKWKSLHRQLKGTSHHSLVTGVVERILIPSFLPRNVLHITVEHSKMPWLLHLCYPDRFHMNHVNSEDICELIVDRGMFDDHLPNRVLSALLHCQKQIVGRQYKSNEVELLRLEERRKISELIAQRKSLPILSVGETTSCASLNVHNGAENCDNALGSHLDSNPSDSHSNVAVTDQPVDIVQEIQRKCKMKIEPQ